jgi:hypothetical protein
MGAATFGVLACVQVLGGVPKVEAQAGSEVTRMDPATLGTLFTGLGLGGIIITAMNWMRHRTGDSASVTQQLVDSAATASQTLSAALVEVRLELEKVHVELDKSNGRIAHLERDVRFLREMERKHIAWAGIHKVWPPSMVDGGQQLWDSL